MNTSRSKQLLEERIQTVLQAKNIPLIHHLKNYQDSENNVSVPRPESKNLKLEKVQQKQKKIKSKTFYNRQIDSSVSQQLNQYITYVTDAINQRKINRKMRQLGSNKTESRVNGNSHIYPNLCNKFDEVLQKLTELRNQRLQAESLTPIVSKLNQTQLALGISSNLKNSRKFGEQSFLSQLKKVGSSSKNYSGLSFEQLVKLQREQFQSKRERRKIKRSSMESVDGRIRLLKRQAT